MWLPVSISKLLSNCFVHDTHWVTFCHFYSTTKQALFGTRFDKCLKTNKIFRSSPEITVTIPVCCDGN